MRSAACLRSTLRQGAASQSLQIFSASLVTQIIGLVITVMSIRLLTTENFAALTAILIWISIIPLLFAFGIPDAMVTASGERSQVRLVYACGFLLTLILSALAGITTQIVCRILLDANMKMCLLASGSVTVGVMSSWLLSLEQRLRQFRKYSVLMVSSNLITLIIVLPALINPTLRTAAYILSARLIGNSLPIIARIIYRRKYASVSALTFAPQLLRTGARFQLSGLINVGGSRIDQILSAHLLTSPGLAGLGVILPFTNATRGFGFALSTVGLVEAVESSTSIERVLQRRQAVNHGLLGAFAVASLTAGGIYAMLPYFGDSAATLTTAIILLYMCAAACTAVTDISIRMDRTLNIVLPGVCARIASIITVVPLSLTLIPKYGLLGSAITAFVVSIIGLSVMLGAMLRPMNHQE